MASREEKHISDSYNTGAKKYCEHWSVPHTFTEMDRNNFCALLPQNSKILDVGCGPGNDTTFFVEKGFNVLGVDLSKEMVRCATTRETRAKFAEMDMRHLTFEDNYFEGVWASFSFLHVKKSDAKETLQQFKRVLCQNGHLCLLVHTSKTSTYRQAPISGLFDDSGGSASTYVQERKQEDLLALLDEGGFEPRIVRPFGREGGAYPLLSIIAKAMK